jgi:hypothetical protein
MFAEHFYHQRIRMSVAAFGSLFNDITVVRKGSNGNIINTVKVPLSYAPRRSFIERIEQMSLGEASERKVAIKLPRLSFELLAINYDPARQIPKTNYGRTEENNSEAFKIYTRVPFNLQFQVNAYAKSQDDALQIVEQIIPYFDPQYNITVVPLADFPNIKEDNPIRLDGIVFSDDFEGALEARRTIVYTLDFEMKINMYKRIGNRGPVITQVEASAFDLDDNSLQDVFRFDSSNI